MRRERLIFTAALILAVAASSAVTRSAAAGPTVADSADENLASLHKLILPGADDSQWMSVSWLPATNIWAARQKAAAEGKPIFLWYMAGEPLGPC